MCQLHPSFPPWILTSDRNRLGTISQEIDSSFEEIVRLANLCLLGCHPVPRSSLYTLIDVSSDERSFVPLIIHITRPMHLCHRYRGYDRSVPQATPQKSQPPHSVFYSASSPTRSSLTSPEVPITTTVGSNHPSNDDIEMKGRKKKKKYIYQKVSPVGRWYCAAIEACDSLSRNKWKRVESSSWNRLGRGWKISRVESFDRVKDDGRKEFGLDVEDGTVAPRVDTCYVRQRRVKASIKTSMVHRERAWYSWQAPFYRVEAPFRWVGSEGLAAGWIERGPRGVGEVYATWGQNSRGLPPRRGTKEVRRVKERRYSGG